MTGKPGGQQTGKPGEKCKPGSREESSGMVESASTHDGKSRARGAANAATEAQQQTGEGSGNLSKTSPSLS